MRSTNGREVLPFVTRQLRGFTVVAPGVQMYDEEETKATTTTAREKQAGGENLIYLILPNYDKQQPV